MGYYVTEEGARALKAYKYRGKDESLLYKHVLTKWAELLTSYFPLWLAPNVITLMGLAAIGSAHVLTAIYSPNFDRPLPPWLYVYCALGFLAYQTLDNCDGKQARRTGTSSPLGLLFDHGVDALNTTVATLVQCAVMQTGNGATLLVTWLMTNLPFVLATWEEYYVGELSLGVFNGPSDGMALAMCFCLMGAFSPGIWGRSMAQLSPTIFGDISLPAHWLIIGAAYIALVPTFYWNVRAVVKLRENFKASHPVVTLLPFATHILLILAWYNLSPSGIFEAHPRLFLFTQGLLFCNMICKLMLAHLCSYVYSPWRSVLLPLIGAVANIAYSAYTGTAPFIPEDMALHAVFGFNLAFWMHFNLSVIAEITSVLNIKCFSITPKPAMAKAA